ncbi:MAG: TolC family protein [Prevotella sp.]|nr:TolC family protein [Prevotella sp.]
MEMINRNKRKLVARAVMLGLLVLLPSAVSGQRLLTLDSCRAMALRNNKQMRVAELKQEVTANTRKSARTKYLPQVNALGGYVWTSKEMSILNDDQKSTLSNMGTNMATKLQSALSPLVSTLPAETQMKMGSDLAAFGGAINQVGAGVVDGFRTDTRNMFAGAVMVTQPLFMGGAIIAANKMADINEELAANSLDLKRQNTLYTVDQAYWQVVSLKHKQTLAESYVALVQKLQNDVQKMIDQGVATKGDGLSVSVRVNEAEMALTQVSDGLSLSKMLLCQLCGLPLDEEIELADNLTTAPVPDASASGVSQRLARPELRMLQNAVDLSRQSTNVLKAGNLPQLMLTGGYAVTNPNTFNGFEKKFAGFWNVGVMLRVPVWNWGDVKYKVRASKASTAMASLELDDAREMIDLQVRQSNFKVNEAYKKLTMAQSNVANADENLRMANLGFKEGTVSFTTVMEAQTAWQLAQTQKIDAEIGVKISQVELQKALGTLAP